MVTWPERFDERVHIIAHGETFDVDAFLASSILRPDFVWRRPTPVTSGVELLLGDGRQMNLIDQENCAIAYIRDHREALLHLAQFQGVNAFILGLVYIAKLDAGITGAALDWPTALMLAATDVGLTPVHYITYDHPKEPEPYASFCLWGTFDPDDVTARVGMTPSKTLRVGDAIEKSGRKRKNSLWAMCSRLDSSCSMDLHITDILDQLDENKKFERLIHEFEGLIKIVGLPQNYGPAVSLEPELLTRIARYRLRLDVDRNC